MCQLLLTNRCAYTIVYRLKHPQKHGRIMEINRHNARLFLYEDTRLVIQTSNGAGYCVTLEGVEYEGDRNHEQVCFGIAFEGSELAGALVFKTMGVTELWLFAGSESRMLGFRCSANQVDVLTVTSPQEPDGIAEIAPMSFASDILSMRLV